VEEEAPVEIWEIIDSVKMVTVYLSFENNKIKLMVSFKCYDSFECIAVMNLQ
jgi:hypothetical protein